MASRQHLVCASCFEGLVKLGATPVHGDRAGSLLDRCTAHPSPLGVHAALRVDVEDELVVKWQTDEWRSDGATAEQREAAALVATLAATLLASGHGLESNDAEILQSVVVARQLLSAAKGEAIR